jgi:hypothetical protein
MDYTGFRGVPDRMGGLGYVAGPCYMGVLGIAATESKFTLNHRCPNKIKQDNVFLPSAVFVKGTRFLHEFNIAAAGTVDREFVCIRIYILVYIYVYVYILYVYTYKVSVSSLWDTVGLILLFRSASFGASIWLPVGHL